MQTESTFSPNRCEVSKKVAGPSAEHPTAADIESYANRYLSAHGRFPGYGLVQWTGQYSKSVPYTWENQKYIYWCSQQGLDPADIDSQLERIIWECDNGVQFYSTSAYPLTFKEFSTSNLPADYLAKAFLKNYEVSANPDYDTRGRQGMEWYNFLSKYAPEAASPTSIKNLKIDKLLPTKLTASFIAQGSEKCVYEVKAKSKIANKGTLLVEATENAIKIGSFTCTNLLPNTTYSLRVKLIGNADSDSIEETVHFTTPQAFPKSLPEISLEATDALLPHENFRLNTTPLSSTDWGHWKKPANGGYIIQLIVNGKVVEEKIKNDLVKAWHFNLNSEFKNYKSKVGDIIQVGIYTWVKDDKGEMIFDNQAIKISNPICFLRQPMIAYLNK
jgi:hypothetical protein